MKKNSEFVWFFASFRFSNSISVTKDVTTLVADDATSTEEKTTHSNGITTQSTDIRSKECRASLISQKSTITLWINFITLLMIRYNFYEDAYYVRCNVFSYERFILFKFSLVFFYLSLETRYCMNHDFQQNHNYITTISIIKESVLNTCWNNTLWLYPKSHVLVVITNECMHRRISIYHTITAFKLFVLCCYS